MARWFARGNDCPSGNQGAVCRTLTPDLLPPYRNYHLDREMDSEGRESIIPVPHTMPKIAGDLAKLAPGWPKRVGERLFVERGHEPVYLGSATRLFAWIDQAAHVDWRRGPELVTQERFFEFQRMTAGRHDSIETMPHVPPMPGAYYMHPELPAPSGKLDGLLDRFLPSSDVDRQLIKALVMTPLWGGLPGTRPAFLVTGPDYDPEQGRGLGKSSMLDLISNELYGGAIDVSPGEDDMGVVKTRLLSEQGASRRIIRLDNVKTLRFSWPDLEAMISATDVSGRMLYVGEGRRRNDLVWIITLNGASLSKDMAQRVVTIKLSRPPKSRDPRWRDEITDYMRDHRWDIIAEIAEILGRPAGPLVPKSRWAAWESGILSKLDQAEECQRAMIDRQDTIDEGSADRDTFRDALCDCIRAENFDPETSLLKMTSKTAAEILSKATRKHYETGPATTHIKGLGIAELATHREAGCRGWVWRGTKTEESRPTLFNPVTWKQE